MLSSKFYGALEKALPSLKEILGYHEEYQCPNCDDYIEVGEGTYYFTNPGQLEQRAVNEMKAMLLEFDEGKKVVAEFVEIMKSERSDLDWS